MQASDTFTFIQHLVYTLTGTSVLVLQYHHSNKPYTCSYRHFSMHDERMLVKLKVSQTERLTLD